MNTTTIIWLVAINLLLALLFFLILKKNYFLIVLYALIWGLIFYYFPDKKSLLYFGVPHLVVGFLFHLMLKSNDPSKEESVFNMLIQTEAGLRVLNNIDRGTTIFGASGSGKTASGVNAFIQHFKKFNFSGILYDFKNGELTELAIDAFGKENVKIIAPHDPIISDRCNFIKPEIMYDEVTINEITKILISNLLNVKGEGDFFISTAEALLSAVILKFKIDHPELCTFPHIAAFLTTNNFGGYREVKYIDKGEEKYNLEFSEFKQLEDFLSSNKRVQIQASAFLKGLASERQTASVISTLLNALRKLSNPRFFWVFSGNDFEFNINSPDNRIIVSVLNDPSSALTVTPFVASTIHSITTSMSVRNMEPSFLLLDEAATLKLPNMAQIPATMRSFKVVTVYATQDVVQGYVQYGINEFKQIMANLSIQIFGKSNDPDTALFYEKYMELIEEDRVSKTKDTDSFMSGTKSINVSKQEKRKIKAQEFMQLLPGEFVKIINGRSEKIKFSQPVLNPIHMTKKTVTDGELEHNFNNIIKEVNKLTLSEDKNI